MALYDFNGARQVDKYRKMSDDLWAQEERQLIDEMTHIMESNSAGQLVEMTSRFAKRIESPELECRLDEVESLKTLMSTHGSKLLIRDFLSQKVKTKNLTMIGLPALAAADGVGDVDEYSKMEWLHSVCWEHPFSCDVADDVVDRDFKNHPTIPREKWETVYKVTSATIFNIGQLHAKNIRTGDAEVDQEIQMRLETGITEVSKSNRFDLELQKSKNASAEQVLANYKGKTGEIESTIFATMPSRRRAPVKTLSDGAEQLGVEYQLEDDYEDLNGNPKEEELPKIPNPSYFLTLSQEGVRSGQSFEDAMRSAATKSFEVANSYHSRLVAKYNELGEDFPTKPCFNALIYMLNFILKENYEKFMQGKTFDALIPQLKNLV